MALLANRTPATERARIREGLADGSVDLVVGTHALLTDDVRFRALGVAVIDEQHRFGVEQRAALRSKGRDRSGAGADPDVLVMTATPIPRTAAMVVFGDLDMTLLDELPSGRTPVETRWARDRRRRRRGLGAECAQSPPRVIAASSSVRSWRGRSASRRARRPLRWRG